MKRVPRSLAALVMAASLGPTVAVAQDGRAKRDSYYYYGPSGLAKYWHEPSNKDAPLQRLGRDTWIHWTWGNQRVLRRAAVLAGNLPVPISIDLFRLLDSRKRGSAMPQKFRRARIDAIAGRFRPRSAARWLSCPAAMWVRSASDSRGCRSGP